MARESGFEFERGELQELGYKVVDAIADRLTSMRDLPLSIETSRDAMEALLREPMPREPGDVVEVIEDAVRDVLGHALPIDHPRFFAFVPSPMTYVSVLADMLVAGWNPFVGSWLASSGPSMVELIVLDWLREACGLAASARGVLTSGGSSANLTCLQVARDRREEAEHARLVAYYSDQTHSSVERALKTLGIHTDRRRELPSDGSFCLDPGSLREAIDADIERGLVPWCVIANAGTTNTAAVDPLGPIGALCRERSMWMHIDGAYGASAALCDEGSELLEGMGLGDSLVLDPHKWLFQSYEIGCAFIREGHLLEETFGVMADYMKDVVAQEGHVNFRDRSLQLSRSFRALKLWMTFKVYGSETLARWIERGIDNARYAQRCIESLSSWRVVTGASLGVVTFRHEPDGMGPDEADAHNDAIAREMLRSQVAFVTSTRLRDRTVQRLCTIHPCTDEKDLGALCEAFDTTARRLRANA